MGGLGVGAPVTLRGVKVGRVQQIRLADNNWVEADLKVRSDVDLPVRPVVIAASSSLFGEWEATIVSGDTPQEDPSLRFMLAEAAKPGGAAWAGATLPDVGQLTAQAGRIAGDIAALADRVETAFDSGAVQDLRGTLRDFAQTVSKLQDLPASRPPDSMRLLATWRPARGTSPGPRAAWRTRWSGWTRPPTVGRSARYSTAASRPRTISARRPPTSRNAGDHARQRGKPDPRPDHRGHLASPDAVGEGISGLLTADSTLYRETTATVIQMRQLLTDIQANPRKYFKFSVF